MANPEHVKIVRGGLKALRQWQRENGSIKFDLEEADLRGTVLIGSDLSGANLDGADLRQADLSRAILIKAGLSRARLQKANLHMADLGEANLQEAELVSANLTRATFPSADLTNADLTHADLRFGTLYETNLSLAALVEAKLGSAFLIGANLAGADLTGADLSGAKCGGTVFGDLDLSNVIGLDTISHQSPSVVGVDTLYKSMGKIPDIFLRGCGVPEDLITYLLSLTGSLKPIEFYSCFISYSHKNEEFAKQLHARMQKERLRVWYAPEHMKAGQKMEEQIDRAIRAFDKLLLVLSKESMKSEWVVTEIRKAREAERKSKRRKLFPIRLVGHLSCSSP
jgi:hypothetical protein